MLRRHEINAPTGFERSVPFQAVQFYTAQVRLHTRARMSGAANDSHGVTIQVLLGLDALHSNGYVYRCVSFAGALSAVSDLRPRSSLVFSDLKPENILMDGSGNLKLADLGFAKLVFEGGRAYTVCGTPDYLAPEVIEHRGATRGSDYWALGILIFEFISGCVGCAGPCAAAPSD